MSTRIRAVLSGTVSFVRKERKSLGYLLVSVLIGTIGFEVGLLRGSMVVSAPLVIETPVGDIASAECRAPSVAGAATEAVGTVPTGPVPGSVECRFIGSRNSDLYHSPGCGAANRIKEENTVCFRDEVDAATKGYRPGCVR